MEDGHFYFCKQFTEQSAKSKRLGINGVDVIAFVLSKTFGSPSYCQNKWSERKITKRYFYSLKQSSGVNTKAPTCMAGAYFVQYNTSHCDGENVEIALKTIMIN